MSDYTKIVDDIQKGGNNREEALMKLATDTRLEAFIKETIVNESFEPKPDFDWYHEEAIILFDRAIRLKLISPKDIEASVDDKDNEDESKKKKSKRDLFFERLLRAIWRSRFNTIPGLQEHAIATINEDQTLRNKINNRLYSSLDCQPHNQKEIYQKALITLTKNLKARKYKARGPLKGYFANMCYNVGRNTMRSIRKNPATPLRDDTKQGIVGIIDHNSIQKEAPSAYLESEKNLLLEETFERINDWMGLLDDSCKELLLLLAKEFTVAEIAKKFGKENQQISRKIYKCRKKLIGIIGGNPLKDSSLLY